MNASETDGPGDRVSAARVDDRTEVATAAQRLAVLLDAGLEPRSAWRALAAADDAPEILRTVDAVAGAATELPSALRRAVAAAGVTAPRHRRRRRGALADWSAVAAALAVAGESGAPLAPTLLRLSGVLRDRAESDREVETALAGPAATARIVVLLPLVGILFGLAIGTDTLSTLFVTPIGWCCLAVGLGLLALAGLWTRSMLARARAHPSSPGLTLELTAIALAGGLSPERALALVRSQTGALTDDQGDTEAVLAFAGSVGVPAGSLLRAEAEDARRRAAADARRRAAVLGVRLMLPLGLCVLPSFLALGVVPIVVSLLSSTAAGF